MTTRQIQKNFKLSAEFSEYVLEHPEVLNRIPQRAQIIFSHAEADAHIDGFVYVAEKRGRKWSVKAIK